MGDVAGRQGEGSIARLLGKMSGGRDVSDQEVCHSLLNVQLFDSSREIILLDRRVPEIHGRGPSSLFRCYMCSETSVPGLRDATLLQVARDWFTEGASSGRTSLVRRLSRVVTYLPQHSSDLTSPEYEHFCRVGMTQHRPFSAVEDLLFIAYT
ncbi:uncharacterized protein J3D65DRAFT_640334 [Phyllosticta citribraziliensis]|uniref:Uncharacterized protein n=1 Tax=Phyllosticta citribraziliensis TaxID=989973 RepID=A0ABR1L8I8_9PEZI